MAQLSIFEKQRHHSDKDFTCSIGKNSRIYITFRHETWKRFTSTEYISVYVGKNGAIKFGDPKDTKMLAPCFKLQQGKAGDAETRATTRYLQLEGKKYPAILEQIRRTAGSYDFPPLPMSEEEKKALTKKIAKELNAKIVEEPPKKLTEEELETLKTLKNAKLEFKPYTKEMREADAFTVRRNQFKEDLKTLTDGVESQEERIAIINALAGLYGRNNKTVPYDPTDPWDIP